MIPFPLWSVWMSRRCERRLAKELFSSLFIKGSKFLWIAPMLAVETFPYCTRNCSAFSPTNCTMERRSSGQEQVPVVVGDLKDKAQHPLCVSLRLSRRLRRSVPCRILSCGPGAQFTQNVPEDNRIAFEMKIREPEFLYPFCTFGWSPPALAMLARSPLTSAIKTGPRSC